MAASRLVGDQDGAKIIHVGEGRAGDDGIAQGAKEAVPVVICQRLARPKALGPAAGQAVGGEKGAGTLSVHRLILGSSLRMILPGIGVGLLGALALGRLISAQLYGVRAADPLVLALVVAVLGAASLLACLIPSIQAARMSPMDALRDE